MHDPIKITILCLPNFHVIYVICKKSYNIYSIYSILLPQSNTANANSKMLYEYFGCKSKFLLDALYCRQIIKQHYILWSVWFEYVEM